MEDQKLSCKFSWLGSGALVHPCFESGLHIDPYICMIKWELVQVVLFQKRNLISATRSLLIVRRNHLSFASSANLVQSCKTCHERFSSAHGTFKLVSLHKLAAFWFPLFCGYAFSDSRCMGSAPLCRWHWEIRNSGRLY